MTNEAKTARYEVEDLVEAAEDLRDYPGRYFPAKAKAAAAMTVWRKRYPEVASDFANATTDEDRAKLIRECDEVNAEIASEHCAAGHVSEYQNAAGLTRQSHRTVSMDAARVIARMKRGES